MIVWFIFRLRWRIKTWYQWMNKSVRQFDFCSLSLTLFQLGRQWKLIISINIQNRRAISWNIQSIRYPSKSRSIIFSLCFVSDFIYRELQSVHSVIENMLSHFTVCHSSWFPLASLLLDAFYSFFIELKSSDSLPTSKYFRWSINAHTRHSRAGIELN